MIKRHPGSPLSAAELEQRRDAAHHRHKAETAPGAHSSEEVKTAYADLGHTLRAIEEHAKRKQAEDIVRRHGDNPAKMYSSLINHYYEHVAPHKHKAETAPSVRQGSTSAPGPAAAGLFRQGQQRPDSRGGRGLWDTRTEEEPVGSVNARFRLHLPKAYRSTLPNELL